jgi:hypothetical protein
MENKENKPTFATVVILLSMSFVFAIYFVWAWAIVFGCFWSWFVASNFSMPDLSWQQSVVVSLGLSLLHCRLNNINDVKTELKDIYWKAFNAFVTHAIVPWIFCIGMLLVLVIFF